jgi:hypothetical protein
MINNEINISKIKELCRQVLNLPLDDYHGNCANADYGCPFCGYVPFGVTDMQSVVHKPNCAYLLAQQLMLNVRKLQIESIKQMKLLCCDIYIDEPNYIVDLYSDESTDELYTIDKNDNIRRWVTLQVSNVIPDKYKDQIHDDYPDTDFMHGDEIIIPAEYIIELKLKD